MPQLDSNTFIYQYTGIIVLLICIYTTLSYIVLPILLRSLLIRNTFLKTHTSLTTTLNLLTSSPSILIGQADKINVLSNSLTIVGSTLSKLVSFSQTEKALFWANQVSSLNKFFNVQNFSVIYFSLFISISFDEEQSEI